MPAPPLFPALSGVARVRVAANAATQPQHATPSAPPITRTPFLPPVPVVVAPAIPPSLSSAAFAPAFEPRVAHADLAFVSHCTMAAPAAATYPVAYSSPLGELSDDNMALDSDTDSASDSAAPAPAPQTAVHAQPHIQFSALNNDDDSDAEGDVDADGDADIDAEGDPDYADADADDAGVVEQYQVAGGSGVSSKVCVCVYLNFILAWGSDRSLYLVLIFRMWYRSSEVCVSHFTTLISCAH